MKCGRGLRGAELGSVFTTETPRHSEEVSSLFLIVVRETRTSGARSLFMGLLDGTALGPILIGILQLILCDLEGTLGLVFRDAEIL